MADIAYSQLDEVIHYTSYDDLTGLPNRLLFRDRLQALCLKCKEIIIRPIRKFYTPYVVLFSALSPSYAISYVHGKIIRR